MLKWRKRLVSPPLSLRRAFKHVSLECCLDYAFFIHFICECVIILAKMATNLLFRTSQPAVYLPIRLGCSVLFLLKLRKTVVRLFSRCDILANMPRSKKVSHVTILAKMATNLLFRISQPATYLPIRLGYSILPKRRYSTILAKNFS